MQTEYEKTHDGKAYKVQCTQEVKDVGVCIADNLKPGLQCAKAALKAMSVLSLIKRQFGKLDKTSFQLLYKTHVQRHMEYCVQAWSSYLVKDIIECLEKVKRRATRMVQRLEHVTYTERLKIMGLYIHEKRQL